MYKKVIIIGAGGHAKVVADIILASNHEVVGFLDDNMKIGTTIIKEHELKVVGKINDCYDLEKKYAAQFIVAIGDNKIREKIADRYKLDYYTAIHPTVVIGSDVEIGVGTVVMANTCINCSVKIGKHCIINTASVIEHDNYINDFSHVSPNATLSGTVKIGKDVHIGAGAIIKNNINICDNVIVGAGGVVVKDIEEAGTYVGVPARRIEK